MTRVTMVITLLAMGTVSALAQETGWIGVTVADRAEGGVLIRAVDANSPAATAGLRQDDIIIEYDHQMVVGVLQLTRLVRETPVGRTVDVRIRRDGQEETIQVTASRGPNPFATLRDGVVRALPDFQFRVPNIQVVTSLSQSGIGVISLTPQLREFFGAGTDLGVLVASVEADSAAERAGVRAGDVIISVNGSELSTPQEFSREIRSSGSGTTMQIIRDKQQREIRFS